MSYEKAILITIFAVHTCVKAVCAAVSERKIVDFRQKAAPASLLGNRGGFSNPDAAAPACTACPVIRMQLRGSHAVMQS
jgi:hypothetical protein